MPHLRHASDYEPLAPARTARGRHADEADWLPPRPAENPTDEASSGVNASGVSTNGDADANAAANAATDGAAALAAADSARERASSSPARALLRRGHALSYAGLFLFTVVLYFRPYEYLPLPLTLAFWVAALTLAVYFPTQLALEGNLTAMTTEVKLVLLLSALALASIPLAVSPGRAWGAFNETFVKAVLMFLVLVNAVRTRRRLKWLLLLALAVSCVLSASAVEDFRAGNFTVEGYRVAGTIGGMFGNPNDMALHLVTMVPLALALALGARGLVTRLVFAALALLFAGAIVVTYSRGGFLGLAAVVFVLAWKLGRRRRLSVMLVAACALLLLFALAPGNYFERVASIFGMGSDTGSATQRQALFWRSLLVAAANPVLGVGIGNFPAVSIREQVSHNAYTQVAAEMGLAATVVYVLFMLAPLRSLSRMERARFGGRRRDRDYHLAVGLQAAVVGYMVSSFFASVAYQWYVYYLVGYAVALRRITAAEEARDVAREADAADAERRASAGDGADLTRALDAADGAHAWR